MTHTDTATAAPTADVRFGIGSLLWANVMPLWQRLRRGEGLLIAVNLSLVVATRPEVGHLVVQALVSTAVMIVLYLLNDLWDCERDLNDPGKDQAFVRYLVRHRRVMHWVLWSEHVAIAGVAFALLGLHSALAVVAVAVVNWAYSADVKGRAILDVPWVALWGGLYAAVTAVAVPFALYAVVGLMTSIAHVFQITRDRSADQVNRVRTSAVAVPWLPTVEMAAACLGMGLCIGSRLGPWAGVTATAPFLLYLTMRSNEVAWMMARVYYGAIWVMLLSTVHGA